VRAWVQAVAVAVVLLLARGAAAAPIEGAPPLPTTTTTTTTTTKSSLVDLNTATVEQLCTLPGIGAKKAAAIQAYRSKRPFTRVTQLLEVKGIGRRTLERLRPLVVVADAQAAPAS
jgi:competence protein ComEA